MGDRLRIPGRRDVPAAIDRPDASHAVVACPPHPRMGGDRRDRLLRAVSDALVDRDTACLRFDYGPWDGGIGERADARRALAWARDEFDRTGLFGYSFGGAVAVLAAAAESANGTPPAVTSVLSPASTLDDAGVAPAVDDLDCPLQVVSGEHDETVDSAPVAERARACGHTTEVVDGDHFFVGGRERVAEVVAPFLVARL